MHDFAYERAASVEAALAAKRGTAGALFLAGGMSLLPVLKKRLAAPSLLIDLRPLAELAEIRLSGDRLIIGAMTTHAAVAASPVVRSAIPALAWLAGEIGDPQVRNLGTLGGALAHNDPAADYPAAILALAATIITDRRQILADAFFRGLFRTALEADELILRVAFPVPEKAGYARVCQQASRYPLVAVMAAKMAGEARIAVTGAGPCVFRPLQLEAALAAGFATTALNGVSITAANLNSDIHGGAEYRAHLIGVLARRAIAAAV